MTRLRSITNYHCDDRSLSPLGAAGCHGRQVAVEDIDDLIDIILLENQPDSGNADRSFARYQPAFNDTENIVSSIHGLLTRFTQSDL